MQIALRYVTRFRYRTPVWDSHNALRACPRTDAFQHDVSYRLHIEPATRVHTYLDRWGTRVDTFGVRAPHDELLVEAIASVTTLPRPSPDPVDSGALDRAELREEHWIFVQPTGHTRWTADMADEGKSLVDGVDDVVTRVRTVMEHVHRRMAYVPGATSIGVDPSRVWAQKEGVCQDYAHLAIAFLRSQGIPARYVSGYFYAADASDGGSPDGAEIVVQTHAWVEALIPGFGWWALDPTNGLAVGERHITIGHGRDYDDVTPLRGVYYGDTEHDLRAEVTMGLGSVRSTRLPDVELSAVDQ